MSTITLAPNIVPPPPAFYRQPLSIGAVPIVSRFTLAPLAGYTNYPFRKIIRDIGGVGLCTTDLVNARGIIESLPKTMELLATGPDDRPLSVQIFGSNPKEMADSARWLQGYGATLIDINMGCPVRKVVKTGGGSAMMCDTTGTTVNLIRGIVEAVSIPVTVKMRLGWDDANLTAPFFAREFEQIGVAGITIHGRTREQGFSGNANLSGIRAVVEAVERIPIFGNGDVRSMADAARMIDETGCQGIAIGRGALANPWIFRQLHTWVQTGEPGPRASYRERIDFMDRHVRGLCEWRKGERYGCTHFRKVSAWYGKALRMPKDLRAKLNMISCLADFDVVANQLREAGPPPGWGDWDTHSAHVAVPSGPIAHW